GHGSRFVYSYTLANVRFLRVAARRPVHLIAGVADGLRAGEAAAAVRAARAGRAIGTSFYDLKTSGPREWRALAAWPIAALAVLGAGLIRLVFSVARRLIAGRVSLGVEYDLRNRMYAHLQALELGFFDTQQTGQLMSRATVDLQAVRFFLGYGLIFMAQSLVTVIVAAALMFSLNPLLGALTLAPTPFVVWTAARYGRRNRPASQEVQQRIAE